jgi:hypothetical protein
MLKLLSLRPEIYVNATIYVCECYREHAWRDDGLKKIA